MKDTSFYSLEELAEIGLKSYGNHVLISRKCSFYGAKNISVGNHVRIDDFCILSGKITIGNYVHIGAYCGLYGSHGIFIEDYSGLSPRCALFSVSDDFSGEYLLGPEIPDQYRNVIGKPIHLHKFVNIGAGCIIMPGVTVEENVAVGTMSLVRKSLKGGAIYACMPPPLKCLKPRSPGLKKLATKLENET